MEKLMIVDGNSILNRAFYGLIGPRLLTTSTGIHTNAVYGFINILNKYIEEENPQYLCVAFDLKGPTFRHAEFKDYKANRKGMPDELSEQLPIMKEVLDAMGVVRIEIEGYEADDILGTISKNAEAKGLKTVILTGDRDSLQLASETTRIKLPITKSGVTETEEYDAEGVIEHYGVTPRQFIDVKGLMGDKSDNIPGVPGIGEKTALALIQEFGSIDAIYENIEQLKKKGVKQKLIDNKDLAFLSRKIAEIIRDVPLPCTVEDMKQKDYNKTLLYELFRKLEFSSLIEKFKLSPAISYVNQQEFSKINKDPEYTYTTNLINNKNELVKLKERLTDSESIEIFFLTDKINIFENSLSLIAFKTIDNVISCISLQRDDRPNAMNVIQAELSELHEEVLKTENSDSETEQSSCILIEDFLREIGPIFSDGKIKKSGHDLKPLITYLKWRDIEFKGLAFDTMLAAYILNPSRNSYTISEISAEYLGQIFPELTELTGKGKNFKPFCKIDRSKLLPCVFDHCSALSSLIPVFKKMIESNSQENLYYEIELPLIEVLSDMEFHGFKIKAEELKELSSKLNEKIGTITEEIYNEAGEEFNINSPKQLSVILFEKLGLPTLKKTKRSPSA